MYRKYAALHVGMPRQGGQAAKGENGGMYPAKDMRKYEAEGNISTIVPRP